MMTDRRGLPLLSPVVIFWLGIITGQSKQPLGTNLLSMQYLSDDWLTAADKAFASAMANSSQEDAGESGESARAPLAVGYEISETPMGKVKYTVRFDSDDPGITIPSPNKRPKKPDATMALDYATAVEIAKSELSPQAAFMQGRLKLGGSVRILIDRADEIQSLGVATNGLLENTEF